MTSSRSPGAVIQRAMTPPEPPYWFARHSKSVIFLILTLALLGGYLAFTIPVAVFPATNFPRILIAVDNGVMPTDQMMVTITRRLEEGVNSVPGLLEVRSITSRGSAEIDLFFDWNVDMFQTLQYVNAAISRVQPELPPTATVVANRLTFASFPIIGYSLTSATIPQTQLWEMATYDIKPRLNRLDGVSTVLVQGGQEPEFHITPDSAKLLAANVTVTDILDAMRRTNLIDSPGLFDRNHQLVLGLISAQVRTPQQIETLRMQRLQRRSMNDDRVIGETLLDERAGVEDAAPCLPQRKLVVLRKRDRALGACARARTVATQDVGERGAPDHGVPARVDVAYRVRIVERTPDPHATLIGISELPQARGQDAFCHDPRIRTVDEGERTVARRVVSRDGLLRVLAGGGVLADDERAVPDQPVPHDEQAVVTLLLSAA